MWLVSISVMLAVVQWASSAGGSPRLPTRRMPPFFWASAVSVVPATSASDANASSTARRDGFRDMRHLQVAHATASTANARSTARRDGFSDMRHLQIVGEPIYHTDGGPPLLRDRAVGTGRLLAGAPVSPRRASEPSMECAVECAAERARILVYKEI